MFLLTAFLGDGPIWWLYMSLLTITILFVMLIVFAIRIDFRRWRQRFLMRMMRLRILRNDGQLLGDGSYGTVINGYFGETKVAVKMSSGDLNKATILMSEIKILSNLGGHENVISLVGASTKFLREGQVHMFIELCPLGDLRSFVEKNLDLYSMMHRVDDRNDKVHQAGATSYVLFDSSLYSAEGATCDLGGSDAGTVAGGDQPQNVGVTVPAQQNLTREPVSVLDKFIWAHQMANGMEYLGEKRIVHADLAARNVLLRSLHNVKIADFGLSSRMNRGRKPDVELWPWSHMAVETLENGHFTPQSDVWGYGVTVWEVFSLCEIPYGGRQGWSMNFYEELKKGYRLEKPICASLEIYKVLLECWNTAPMYRPNFLYLKEFFQDELVRMQNCV